MNQPTFAEGPPVPMMVEGAIDAATLRHLFDDLASVATILSIREKGHACNYAEAQVLTPTVALERLLARSVPAIQIRYRYDGFEWTDTILATRDAFRVVRCRHD